MMSKGLRSLPFFFNVVSLWNHPFSKWTVFPNSGINLSTSVLDIHFLQPLNSQCIIALIERNILVSIQYYFLP